MKTYITVLSYQTDEYFLYLHRTYFHLHNPYYGFLFEPDNNNTNHLLIRLDLEEDDAIYLSLTLNLKLIKDPGDHITASDLECYGNFNTVACFRLSD